MSSTLGLYLLTAVSWIICLGVAALCYTAVRRANEGRSRWERLVAGTGRARTLEETAEAALTVLSSEVTATSWALFRYDERRQYFPLVASRGEGSPEKMQSSPLPLPDALSEIPPFITLEVATRPLGVHMGIHFPVLTVPIPSAEKPVGVARGFGVSPAAFPPIEAALRQLQGPLGQALAAAIERESERHRLADFEVGSHVREALMQSTFSAQRLVENTLGVVTLSTRSTGAFVRLDDHVATVGRQTPEEKDRSFYAGDVKEMWDSDPSSWRRMEATLAEQPMLSRGGAGSDILEPTAVDQALAVPVEIRQRRAGLLALVRRGEEPYTPDDVHLARVFAEQLGRVLDNATAYQVAEDSYRSTLLTLVDLVDGRTPETTGHSARVMWLSILTGQAMGVADNELDALGLAALLHDVGMCSIGDEVLKAQGRLSDDELVRIRQHPHLGGLMCNPLQSPLPVSPAVRSHHERWDGRGYPDGLMKDQIPLHGRIIALSEVFNAYVSPRGYRAPKAFSDAIELIKADKGLAFDPEVVEAFLQVIPREAHRFQGPVGQQLPSTVPTGEA